MDAGLTRAGGGQPAAAMRHATPLVRPGQWGFAGLYRFGRFSALSFTLMLPLIGAGIVARDVPASLLLRLATIAVAFHLFAYVSNDVVDLALDRTEPLRSDSPLVRGLIRPSTALAIALCQVPLAFGIHVAYRGSAVASGALGAATALMLVYNVYGKRLSFPPLSDAIQSLGWTALAIYGSLATGRPLNRAAVGLAALVFVYVLLINGVHGGVRDLANDRRCGARTTAIYLGARTAASGAVILPAAVVRYGVALQALMLALSIGVLVGSWSAYGMPAAYVAAATLVTTHAVLLVLLRMTLQATRRRSDMIRAGILHLVISLGSVMLPFAWLLGRPALLIIGAAYACPVLIMCLHDGLTWK